jgi:hypothetical protein
LSSVKKTTTPWTPKVKGMLLGAGAGGAGDGGTLLFCAIIISFTILLLRSAQSVDFKCFGYYYQWGRNDDGHEYKGGEGLPSVKLASSFIDAGTDGSSQQLAT